MPTWEAVLLEEKGGEDRDTSSGYYENKFACHSSCSANAVKNGDLRTIRKWLYRKVKKKKKEDCIGRGRTLSQWFSFQISFPFFMFLATSYTKDM